jgi:hypothetical protein
MYHADLKELALICDAVEKIEIPKEEWKGLLLKEDDGKVVDLRFNPNTKLYDISTYFLNKYGNEQGCDFFCRYLSIDTFLVKHRERLIRDKLARQNNDRFFEVISTVHEVMLASFGEPEPPLMVAKSNLLNSNGLHFSYTKVVKAVKAYLKSINKGNY